MTETVAEILDAYRGGVVKPEDIVARSFAREYWIRLMVISAAMLTPCFWHRTIVTSDLGSHLYNAWLAQLIRHGEAPGLWIARHHGG